MTSIKECLDIYSKNEKALKKLEKVYGVKMTKVEDQFLEDQWGTRLMLCTTEVDRLAIFLFSQIASCRSWAKMAERRTRDEEVLRQQEEVERLDREDRNKKCELPDLEDEGEESIFEDKQESDPEDSDFSLGRN